MDDTRESQIKLTPNLMKIRSKWYLEVGHKFHSLSVLNEANSVHMEENKIFADESMYLIKVIDSKEVKIEKLEDLSKNNPQEKEKTSNEQITEADINTMKDLGKNNPHEKEQITYERITKDDKNAMKDLSKNNPQEKEKTIYERITGDDKNAMKKTDSGCSVTTATEGIKADENKTTKVTALYEFKANLDDEISSNLETFFFANEQSLSDRNIWIKAKHQLSDQTGFIPSSYVIQDFKSFYLNELWSVFRKATLERRFLMQFVGERLIMEEREIHEKKKAIEHDGLLYNGIKQCWWFNLSRKETEEKLLSCRCESGTFLIRDSSDGKSLALSVKDTSTGTNTAVIHHYKIWVKDGEFYIKEHLKFDNISDMIHSLRSQKEPVMCCMLGEQLAKELPDLPFRDLEIQRESVIVCARYYMTQERKDISYVGKWRSENVIVQTYKRSMIGSFITEISILKQLSHKHVIALLAVCTKDEPFLMVNDMMEIGPLDVYLRNDQGTTLHLSDLLDMTIQIAEGMAYLGSQNIVLRDLRTGNILVGNGNNVKIAGFKMARWLRNGIYKASDENMGEEVPSKWTAIEWFRDSINTDQSYVWSFGVLLYEMITFGETPYKGKTNKETISMISQGYRMEKPENGPLSCPQEYYDVMLQCWDEISSIRPTFTDLIELFNSYALSGQAERNMGRMTVSGKKHPCVFM